MTNPAMSPANGQSDPQNNRASAKRVRGPCRQQLTQQFTGASPGRTAAGNEARRLAAVILEVLAGVQTPTSAALALGIRLPRYYFLEQRALGGLVSACEPRPKGRAVSSDRQIARLERELAVCRRELGRQQALARAAQRVLGLKVSGLKTTAVAAVTAGQPGAPGKGQPASAGTGRAGKRSRKPVVRALRAARVLKADCSTTATVGEVQTPAGDVPWVGGGNPGAAGTDGPSFETQGAQGG
jgi:hypothetical protein